MFKKSDQEAVRELLKIPESPASEYMKHTFKMFQFEIHQSILIMVSILTFILCLVGVYFNIVPFYYLTYIILVAGFFFIKLFCYYDLKILAVRIKMNNLGEKIKYNHPGLTNDRYYMNLDQLQQEFNYTGEDLKDCYYKGIISFTLGFINLILGLSHRFEFHSLLYKSLDISFSFFLFTLAVGFYLRSDTVKNKLRLKFIKYTEPRN